MNADNHNHVLGFNTASKFYRETGDLNKAARFAGIQNPYGTHLRKEAEEYTEGVKTFVSMVCQQLESE